MASLAIMATCAGYPAHPCGENIFFAARMSRVASTGLAGQLQGDGASQSLATAGDKRDFAL